MAAGRVPVESETSILTLAYGFRGVLLSPYALHSKLEQQSSCEGAVKRHFEQRNVKTLQHWK